MGAAGNLWLSRPPYDRGERGIDSPRAITSPDAASVRVPPRATFARLPRLDEVSHADVAVLGVPFDSGVSYRPGARFGPSHIRESSRLLRPYNPPLQVSPFAAQQAAISFVGTRWIWARPWAIEISDWLALLARWAIGATTIRSSPVIPTITPGETPDTGVAGPRVPSLATAKASSDPFFSDTYANRCVSVTVAAEPSPRSSGLVLVAVVCPCGKNRSIVPVRT